ncbi:hypothetical protein O6H91_09G053300 [Diphasiastrum complanatum]|nr:hypothetical protein O6H91_09G053300 [Diphasiastrum complanatum]
MGISILVDPILEGNLDFGLPWLYSGAKRELRNYKVENLPKVDHLLITQGLDDHCHKRTLEPLSKLYPNLHVIATPNAEFILSKLFHRITYLEPGDTTNLQAESGSEVIVRASAGPVLGPPWQRPENGYFLEAREKGFSFYYEPHCVFDKKLLKKEKADVIVTPVIKQMLPAFTLVSGQEDAVKLAQLLQPKYIVTVNNGDLETTGLLSRFVSPVGTVASFKVLLKEILPDAIVLEPKPGVPLEVPISC